MEELFVPYDLALKLKEKGFDLDCLGFYGDDGKLYFDQPVSNFCDGINPLYTVAPLFQQVIDWFREKHDIYVFVAPFVNYNVKNLQFTTCVVFTGRYGREWRHNPFCPKEGDELFNDYYKALTKAIEEALKFFENNQLFL